MRNMLALIGLVVVTFFGVGWYRGWYSFEMSPGENGKKRIQFDVDTSRIASDAKQATQRIEQIANDPNASKVAAPDAKKTEFVGPPVPTDVPVGPPAPADLRIGGFRVRVTPDSGSK